MIEDEDPDMREALKLSLEGVPYLDGQMNMIYSGVLL